MPNKPVCKIAKAYSQMAHASDLKKAGIHLAQHYALYAVICDLIDSGNSETVLRDVADWLSKHGAKVTPNGIGWSITV